MKSAHLTPSRRRSPLVEGRAAASVECVDWRDIALGLLLYAILIGLTIWIAP